MKRINREIADLAKEELGGMTLAPVESNMFVWKGSIPGPEGSPYEGGVFQVNIELMNDYPCVFAIMRVLWRSYSPQFAGAQILCAES